MSNLDDESGEAAAPRTKPRRTTKAQRPLVSFDPRLIELLMRAASGETIRFFADPSGPAKPDPDEPSRALLDAEGKARMKQLIRLRNRLWELRKRMREENHPLAKDVYRAEVVLFRAAWPKNRSMHEKAASLEVRPSDSYIDNLLAEAVGPRAVDVLPKTSSSTLIDSSFLGSLDEEEST